MNVLMATDGSEAAIEAAQRSLDLLRAGARVELVLIIPEYEDPMEDAGGIEGPSISYKRADRDWAKATTEGQAALDRTSAALGTEAEVRLVPADGETGAAIVQVAHEMNAEVLVIGSSNKGWLRRFFQGSVSDYVVHHTPCPVMLIRHEN